MKITISRLRKIALELSSDTEMQPFYDRSTTPTARQAVLWFLAYCENVLESTPNVFRCYVCGEKYQTLPQLKVHILEIHVKQEERWSIDRGNVAKTPELPVDDPTPSKKELPIDNKDK